MEARDLRGLLGRPVAPALAMLGLLAAACSQVGTSSITFWDVMYSMLFFFFWFMAIWIFIAVFADIFRRRDLSGGWKAIWILVIFIVPFLGALIYIVSRPKMTAQDVEMMTQADAAAKAASQVTPVDQIAKLDQLKASGAITEPEYNELKKKAIEG
jgi:hypothetical protein